MPTTFDAQTMTWSGTEDNRRLFAIKFEDANGQEHKLTLPLIVARESFAKLAAMLGDEKERPAGAPQFSKDARTIQVGSMDDEPIVVLWFDKDTPYSFDLGRANALVRDLQAEIVDVTARPPRRRQ